MTKKFVAAAAAASQALHFALPLPRAHTKRHQRRQWRRRRGGAKRKICSNSHLLWYRFVWYDGPSIADCYDCHCCVPRQCQTLIRHYNAQNINHFLTVFFWVRFFFVFWDQIYVLFRSSGSPQPPLSHIYRCLRLPLLPPIKYNIRNANADKKEENTAIDMLIFVNVLLQFVMHHLYCGYHPYIAWPNDCVRCASSDMSIAMSATMKETK